MNCKYCGKEINKIEAIKGFCFPCSDIVIGQYEGLKEEKNKLEEFHNQVCEVHFTKVYELETEIERLKLMVKSITGGLDEAIETNHCLEKRLDVYMVALRMACKQIDDSAKGLYFTPGGDTLETMFLKKAAWEVEQEDVSKNRFNEINE